MYVHTHNTQDLKLPQNFGIQTIFLDRHADCTQEYTRCIIREAKNKKTTAKTTTQNHQASI